MTQEREKTSQEKKKRRHPTGTTKRKPTQESNNEMKRQYKRKGVHRLGVSRGDEEGQTEQNAGYTNRDKLSNRATLS